MATKKLLMSHANNPNVRKFLDVIAQAEGATGYDTAFGGGVISDLSDHPRTLHDFTQTDGKSNKTSAAGRYQFLSKTWDDVAGQLELTNFGPASQDLAAIELLRRNGSLDAVLAGDFDTAIRKSGTTWASLPSSTYPQPKRSEGFIRNALEGAANAIFPAAHAENIPEQAPWSKYGANPSEAQANAPQGPWAKYANQPTQQDGPWSKYSNSENSPSIAEPAITNMPEQPKAETPQAASPSWQQQVRASAPGRFMQGASDVVTGGAQMLVNALPESVVDAVNSGVQAINDIPVIGLAAEAIGIRPATAAQLNQQVANDEKLYQDARKALGQDGMDWWRLGGNIAATAPLASASAPAAATGLGRVGVGAAQGAMFGGLQPVLDGGPYADNKLRQMATGAAAGGAVAAAGNALARMVSPRASTNPQVQTLLDEGVTPTPGQILGGTARNVEDKAMSVPILGDAIRGARNRGTEELNLAALNRAVAPLGQKISSTGRDGIKQANDIISKAYDDVLPRLTFRADGQFARDLGQLQQMAQGLPPAQAQQFENIVRTQVGSRLTPQGAATGFNFKDIESEIGRLGREYLSSATAGERQLGTALVELQNSLRSALQRTNPQAAQELSKINQAYALFTRLQTAAGGAGAVDGVFTPAQLSAAVRAGDRSMRKGAFARGDALMQDLGDAAKSVMQGTVPNSGTADRLLLSGGAALVSPPAAVGLGIGSLPYLPYGNRLAAMLLARRPNLAPRVAEAITQGLIPAPLIAAPLANKVLE